MDISHCVWHGQLILAALLGSGTLRTAAPSCSHFYFGSQLLDPWAAGQLHFTCSMHPLGGSTNHYPCQVVGDNSKMWDWLMEFIQIFLAWIDILGARPNVSPHWSSPASTSACGVGRTWLQVPFSPPCLEAKWLWEKLLHLSKPQFSYL